MCEAERRVLRSWSLGARRMTEMEVRSSGQRVSMCVMVWS